jgi:RNA polymerase sigma factor (sigma-70 family)
MEVLVWFLRRRPHSNGRLVFEVDAELSNQLRQAARASEQAPEVFAAELLARGLEQETQRTRVQAILETLTPREQEVTWLTARGYTNRKMAEILVLSPETVKTHVRHVLEKLGVNSKADLRLLLLDLGIRWWEEATFD